MLSGFQIKASYTHWWSCSQIKKKKIPPLSPANKEKKHPSKSNAILSEGSPAMVVESSHLNARAREDGSLRSQKTGYYLTHDAIYIPPLDYPHKNRKTKLHIRNDYLEL